MYERVIPRDLFNDASLLKCLGQLSLYAIDGCDVRNNNTSWLRVDFEPTAEKESFTIHLDESDGSTFCSNVVVRIHDIQVAVCRLMNDRGRWPLKFATSEGDLIPVFSSLEDGTLSAEFLSFARTLHPRWIAAMNIVTRNDLLNWIDTYYPECDDVVKLSHAITSLDSCPNFGASQIEWCQFLASLPETNWRSLYRGTITLAKYCEAPRACVVVRFFGVKHESGIDFATYSGYGGKRDKAESFGLMQLLGDVNADGQWVWDGHNLPCGFSAEYGSMWSAVASENVELWSEAVQA